MAGTGCCFQGSSQALSFPDNFTPWPYAGPGYISPPHATRGAVLRAFPTPTLSCKEGEEEEGPSCVQNTYWTPSLQGVPENWAGQAEHQLVTCKLFMCTSKFSWPEPGALQH